MAEAIITLPDGRKARITGPDKEALVRKAKEIKSQLQAPSNTNSPGGFAGETLARSALARFSDNLLNTPDLAATLLANTPVARMGAKLLGKETPSIGDDVIPLPTSNDLFAGAQVLGEGAAALTHGNPVPVTGFGEAQEQQAERTSALREENPVQAATGDVLGDAATLITGRGGARALSGNRVANIAEAAPKIANNAQTTLGRAVQSLARSGKNILKRSAEAGTEAATLTALQEGDPLEVGGIVAGTQLAGDAVAKPLLRSVNKVGLGTAVLTATLGSIIAQELMPGGFQIVEETLKNRAKEIGIAAILAGGAALPARRLPKEFAGPAFSEIVNNTSRSALINLVNAIKSDPETTTSISKKFSEDPNFFDEKTRNKLDRAFRGETNLKKTIDRLMKNDKFRIKVEALRPQESTAPKEQQEDS